MQATILNKLTSYIVWLARRQVGAYIMLKILRRDFWYWLRVEGEPVFSIALAGLERVAVKMIIDFTGWPPV